MREQVQEGEETGPCDPCTIDPSTETLLEDEDIDEMIEAEGYLSDSKPARKEVKVTAIPGTTSKNARQVPFAHLYVPSFWQF